MTTYSKRFVCALAMFCTVIALAGCTSSSNPATSDTSSNDASNDSDDGASNGNTIATSVTAITYNVAGLPQEISTVQPKTNIPLINPLLEQFDIVLTQEDFDWFDGVTQELDVVNYHDRLRNNLTFEYTTKPHPGPEAVNLDAENRPLLVIGDGIGIMSRYPFQQAKRVPWPECFGGVADDGGAADCLSMKGFAVARTEMPGGGTVDVYSLHAEAGSTERDQELRMLDFEQLGEFINDYSAGTAIMLGGDMNLHIERDDRPQDALIWASFLQTAGLTDVCSHVGCADNAVIDKFAFRSSESVSVNATSWDKPVAEFSDANGEPLSDHDPIVVEFDIVVSSDEN